MGERVGEQMIASIHGTVDGLVLVGIGERAILMGVVYAFAGVPHPTLFGAVTGIAAIVPFAAPAAFALAALLLILQGSMVTAIVVFTIGMAMALVADHFIRPALIGGATKLPFLWVLLGILGGVEAWGLLGLFLGARHHVGADPAVAGMDRPENVGSRSGARAAAGWADHLEQLRHLGIVTAVAAARDRACGGRVEQPVAQIFGVDMHADDLADHQVTTGCAAIQGGDRHDLEQLAFQRRRRARHPRGV